MPRINTMETDRVITHYAMIDDGTCNPDGSDNSDFVILDCITRQAADSLGNVSWRGIQAGDERLSQTMLLQVDRKQLSAQLPERTDQAQWLSFKLEPAGPNSGGVDGLRATFVSLAGEADDQLPVFVLSAISFVAAKLRKLAFMVGLHGRAKRIEQVLNAAGQRAGTSRNVVVYDIGQGNANALVDEWGHPCLFFDLGWPTSFNQSSRPPFPPDLFACDACYWRDKFKPPVVLSHWDFDHWAYAVSNHNYKFGSNASKITFKPAALDRVWIVPKPPGLKKTGKGLGPTHMRLLASLPKRIPWPNTLKEVSFCAGVITRTDRRVLPRDRNNQALVWFVMKADNRENATLLPGDVDYENMRWPTPAPEIAALVASHHGGSVTAAPGCCAANPLTRFAISVGNPNRHGHPNEGAVLYHFLLGWDPHLLTSNRVSWALAAPKTNGAILVKLDPNDPDPLFSCPCMLAGNLGTTQ